MLVTAYPTYMSGMRHQTKSVSHAVCDWRLRGPTCAHDYFFAAPNLWLWVRAQWLARSALSPCTKMRSDNLGDCWNSQTLLGMPRSAMNEGQEAGHHRRLSRSDALDDDRDALAHADAHRAQCVAALDAVELVD